MSCINVTTNAGGISYLTTTSVNVGTESINFGLGWRRIQPVGYLTIRIANPIPSGATTTLPITLTLNGVTRNLTLPNNVPVTAADLEDVSVILVFNDKFNGLLTLMSRTTV